jgi:hypothetical protein
MPLDSRLGTCTFRGHLIWPVQQRRHRAPHLRITKNALCLIYRTRSPKGNLVPQGNARQISRTPFSVASLETVSACLPPRSALTQCSSKWSQRQSPINNSQQGPVVSGARALFRSHLTLPWPDAPPRPSTCHLHHLQGLRCMNAVWHVPAFAVVAQSQICWVWHQAIEPVGPGGTGRVHSTSYNYFPRLTRYADCGPARAQGTVTDFQI